MRKLRWLMLLVVLALALPSVSLAAPSGPFDPGHASPVSRARPVPPEVVAMFEGGMSIDEFVELTGQVPAALRDFVDKPVMVVLELDRAPMATYYAQQKAAGQSVQAETLRLYQSGLMEIQAEVEQALPTSATVVAHYTAAYNGLMVQVPAKDLAALRAIPHVVGVYRAPEHVPALGASVPLIGATEAWEELGFDGDGVTIAVIDTGIDYTHAAFGGSGDPADYAGNDPDIIEPGTFPTAKVIAGYDFAGTDYDASGTYGPPIPTPDKDPLDEYGHGTHVASIAAGIAAGDVMTGVAPAAKLIALKVFGKAGSTNLTMSAIDAATYSYLLYGYPQVINMSLGSDYGPDDPLDPDIVATNNASAAGIVVVTSAGNAADVPYIVGSPSTADSAISVAASTTGYATAPTINVVGSTAMTLTNIIYQPNAFDEAAAHFTSSVKGPLAYVGAYTTTDTLCDISGWNGDELTGKVALIQRGGCAFSLKAYNAEQLGAIAAIIFNHASGGNELVTMADSGDPNAIPAAFIAHDDGVNLVTVNGQEVVIDAEDDVKMVENRYVPADSIGSFSSRGPRGFDSKLKPEVSAPGVAIFAADMGSGTGGVSFNGTSMAAPHVAGVAALVAQAHPDWTSEQIKAVLMNTAVDLVDGSPIPRQGAGRVDARRAADTPVVVVGDKALVSISDLLVTGEDTVVMSRTVSVENADTIAHTFDLSWELQPDSLTPVDVSLPAEITVPPESTATFDVVFTFDMTSVPTNYWATEEVFGYLVLTPRLYRLYFPLWLQGNYGVTQATVQASTARLMAPEETLRVPFFFAARPYSELTTLSAQTVITPDQVAVIELAASGPVDPDLWVYPGTITDTNEAMQLDAGDIRMIGVDYGWFDGDLGDMIMVGIDAWGGWHTPQPYFAEFDMYLDVDEDGTDDFILFNWNYGAATGGDDTDEWLVFQVDLSNGMLYLASPYLITTDYNTGFMEWYLPALWNGLDPATNTDFDYSFVGWDYRGSFDDTVMASFDYARPPFTWDVVGGPTVLVAIDDLSGYQYSGEPGIMVVDYNGEPGIGQAYYYPLEVVP